MKPERNWLDELTKESPAARYVAWSGELRFAGAREDDLLGRTVKFKIVPAAGAPDAGNPFAQFTRRRKGHAGTRFEAALVAVDGTNIEAMHELMLLNWADSPQGSTVTFVLPLQDGPHPFMNFSRETSAFMAVLVELDDDEATINQEKRARVESAEIKRTRKPQRPSNAAAQMIKNPTFMAFARAKNPAEADHFLKEKIRIQSKAELDTSPEKAKAFNALCDQFVEWQRLANLL